MKVRIVAVLLLTILAASAFATGSAEETAEGGSVSVMVYERGWVAPDLGSVTDNPWTQFIAEDSGLNVEWIAVPRGEVTPTLNTMFAAGTAPDLIHDFPRSTVANFRAQGVLQPVDDIIEQYSGAYAAYLSENPDLVPYVTFDDGEMWAFSSARPIDSIANHTIWLRKDWLDNLGLDVPETEAEFFAMADAFVNDDPDGNGQDDTTAFAAMPAYFPIVDQLYFTNPWYVEDGEVVHRIFTDRFASMLEFHKTAYDNGWLDAEYITDPNRTRQEQLWATGRAGVAFAGTNTNFLGPLYANVPSAEAVPMRPFPTDIGRNGLLDEPLAHRFIGLNAEAESPATAMALIDWFIDGGWFPLTYGNEGEHFEFVNGQIPRRIIDNETYLRELRYAFDLVLVDQRYMEPSWVPIMAADDPTSQRLAQNRAAALEVSLMDDFRRDLPYEPTDDRISQFNAEFNGVYNNIVNETIIGGPDASVADAVAEIRSEWERFGGDEIIAIYNEWFQANREALGY
jgi:putative aldouronate transport system substrate-binding protein